MTKVVVMPSNSESQCYFVQLQIDGYIDGDLSQPQQEVFMAHVQSCQTCAQEFHYAQMVQDTILELPQLDCSEQVLEPIHRFSKAGDNLEDRMRTDNRQSLWSQIKGLFIAAPAFARYGLPMALSVAVAVFISSSVLNPVAINSVDSNQLALEPAEVYSPEEIFQALQDLNIAMDYLSQMSERTEAMISDRFLVTPLQDSINASFEKASTADDTSLQNDPI